MANERILIVEDDEDIQELLTYNLAQEGYRVTRVDSGEAGLETALAEPPDLLLLDLMLPGMSGLEVCRRLKSDPTAQATPIMMVTAKGEEADIVAGLELGADDYVTKPFSPRVLIARARAILRRKNREPINETSPIRVNDLVIHPGRREVVARDQRVQLTYTEFQVLNFLARRPGWVFTRHQIVKAIRGEAYPVTDRSVDVQIVGLRKKLGPCGDYIETVRGVGYRFRDESDV